LRLIKCHSGLTPENEDSLLQEECAEALARIGTSTAINVLAAALRQEEGAAQSAVAQALAAAPEGRGLALLLHALEEGGETARGVAIALCSAGPAVVPALAAALKHGTEDSRLQLIDILANIGDEKAFEAIEAIADDPTEEVRAAAQFALENTKGSGRCEGCGAGLRTRSATRTVRKMLDGTRGLEKTITVTEVYCPKCNVVVNGDLDGALKRISWPQV
jgi:hypothetical protein